MEVSAVLYSLLRAPGLVIIRFLICGGCRGREGEGEGEGEGEEVEEGKEKKKS